MGMTLYSVGAHQVFVPIDCNQITQIGMEAGISPPPMCYFCPFIIDLYMYIINMKGSEYNGKLFKLQGSENMYGIHNNTIREL